MQGAATFNSMIPEPLASIQVIIIIIIKNECHSNITVDRLQGCGHSKKQQGNWKWVTQQ